MTSTSRKDCSRTLEEWEAAEVGAMQGFFLLYHTSRSLILGGGTDTFLGMPHVRSVPTSVFLSMWRVQISAKENSKAVQCLHFRISIKINKFAL